MSWIRKFLESHGFSYRTDAQGIQIEGLRVVVWQNPDGWMAQGLEIDYAAAGDSIEDVIESFAKGLAITLHENQKAFGTIERVLKPAPQEAWKPFLSGQAQPPAQPRYREKLITALAELKDTDILPEHLTSLRLYQQAA